MLSTLIGPRGPCAFGDAADDAESLIKSERPQHGLFAR